MYEILKKINDTTLFASSGNHMFILKQIGIEDSELFKKMLDLHNSNVERIYELTAIEGRFYAVCEYIDGLTLTEYIERNGVQDDDKVKNISLQICSGLEAIHNLGIVHRDINPNNIMITADGEIKIIDFGISRLHKENASADTQILGTQGYAAPEQYGFNQTTASADIYALGVLINYLKTGCLPSEKITDGRFRNIVLKCTEIDSCNRYADIKALKKAIDGKYIFKRFLDTVPGFRTNKLWHKITAIIYYIAVIFLICVSMSFPQNTVRESLLYFFIWFFMFVVPVPILTNYMNWLNTWNFTKKRKQSFKMFTAIFFACLSEIISIKFILIF